MVQWSACTSYEHQVTQLYNAKYSSHATSTHPRPALSIFCNCLSCAELVYKVLPIMETTNIPEKWQTSSTQHTKMEMPEMPVFSGISF
jgi:hypothetical protein